MDYKSYHEYPTVSPQEAERPDEVIAIEELPERLGFVETEEMEQLRARLVEAMADEDREKVRELATQFYALGEEEVNAKQGQDFARAQLGLAIAMCVIRRDAGRLNAYLEDLEEALDNADRMGYQDIVSALETAVAQALELLSKDSTTTEAMEQVSQSQEIAAILSGIGVEFGFDPETCQEVANQPFEEAIETAYSYLTQAGLDADEVLAHFIQ